MEGPKDGDSDSSTVAKAGSNLNVCQKEFAEIIVLLHRDAGPGSVKHREWQ